MKQWTSMCDMTLERRPGGFSSVQEQSYIHSNWEAIAWVFQNQNLLQKIICLDRVHAERLPKIHFLLPSPERSFQCSQEAFVFNNMAGKMPRTIRIWLCVQLVGVANVKLQDIFPANLILSDYIYI